MNREESVQIVTDLVDVLGWHLVAIIGGGRSSADVQDWESGKYVPWRIYALGDALGIARKIEHQHDKVTAQSWFQGMNEHLGDESPALVLRIEGLVTERNLRVWAAAQAFLGAAAGT